MAIELATKFAPYVDEKFTTESKKSMLTNQDFDFVNARTVKIYKISTSEMNDYDRNGAKSGEQWSRYGAVKDLDATTETMTLKKDRSFDWFDKIDSITRQLVKEGRIEPSFTSVQNQKLIFDKYAELLNTDCYVSDRGIIDVHTFTKTIPASIQRDVELKRQLDLVIIYYFTPQV